MYGLVEGTGFEVIKSEFEQCIIGHARVERLWTGARWSEGPVWFAAGRYLLWSDIPNNRIMRWDETDGSVSVFREDSGNSNGNTIDKQGRLVSCEHRHRRVTRTEHDGSITVIADQWQGKCLNSPNDVVVKSDGTIWFTDPSYGIMADYEGERADSEIGACYVYRVNPDTKQIDAVITNMMKPNGLAFSPDERFLYVADTGGSHEPNGPHHIYQYQLNGNDIDQDAKTEFAACNNGLFDGFRFDEQGRIWTSAADGVHCLNANGDLIGKILIPELVANVCFGGANLNRLFICGTTSLYSVYLAINGLKPI